MKNLSLKYSKKQMNIVIDTCNEMKYYIDYDVRNKVRTVKGPKLPTWGDEIAYLKNTIDACIALKHEEFEEIKKVLETNQKNSYIKELVDTYSEFIESINEINQETKKSLFYAHHSKDFNASLKRNEYSIFTVNNIEVNKATPIVKILLEIDLPVLKPFTA